MRSITNPSAVVSGKMVVPTWIHDWSTVSGTSVPPPVTRAAGTGSDPAQTNTALEPNAKSPANPNATQGFVPRIDSPFSMN
jgi:hypothetical protein